MEGDKGDGGMAGVTKEDSEFQFALTVLVIPTFKFLYENYDCVDKGASGSKVCGVRIGKLVHIHPRSTRKKKPTLKSVKDL